MTAGRAAALAGAAWLLAVPVRATAGYAGASGAGELDLPGSALGVVAGSATAGIVRDAAAVRDNPARMGISGTGGATATWAMRPGGLTDSQISGYLARGAAGTFGAAVRLVQASMPLSVEDGTGAYGGTRGSFSYQTFVGSVAWAPDLSAAALALGVPLSAGMSLTYLTRQVQGQPVSGGGGDAGVWVPCGQGLGAFAVVRNIGWTGPVMWPVAAVAGAAIERAGLLAIGDILRASLAASWSRERGATGAVAVECGLGGEDVGTALRIGWETGTVRAISPWPSGGLAVRVAGLSLEAGMGWMGGLGLAKIVTVSYQARGRGDDSGR